MTIPGRFERMRGPGPLPYKKLELTRDQKDAVLSIVDTPGWNIVEDLLHQELNIAFAAMLRLDTDTHYNVGVINGISTIFNLIRDILDRGRFTTAELIEYMDPATAGWAQQFKSRCKHVHTATRDDVVACKSCGHSWKVKDAETLRPMPVQEGPAS